MEIQTSPTVGLAEVVRNNIRLILPDFFEGSSVLSYELKNGIENTIAEVQITTNLSPCYCGQKIKAIGDTFYLPKQEFNFRTFKPEDLIFNDIKCNSETLITSFAIVPVPKRV